MSRHPRKPITTKTKKPKKGQAMNEYAPDRSGRKPSKTLEEKKLALEAERAQLDAEIAELEEELARTAEIFEGAVNDLEAHEVVAALDKRRENLIGGYQNDFAELIGLNSTTYNTYVNRSNHIKWESVVAICEALEVDIFLRPKAKYADKDPV